MPEKETIELRVGEAAQPDVGKGIVRMARSHIRALGLERMDVVEIEGQRTTAAIVLPSHPEAGTQDVITLDGLLRHNAKVGIGDAVRVRKAESVKDATRIVLSPAKAGLRIAGSGDALRPTLLHRPMVQGDLVSTSVFRQDRESVPRDLFSDDFFRGFFESPAFGLMEIRLIVSSTTPRGIVRVTEETEIQLAPERMEPEEQQRAEQVTYDDVGGMRPVVAKVREMIELPLKHPELFDRLGIDAPRGVLLHGPAGTGKTLLARAVAHESGAFFTSINGPEIIGRFYGESEERLREVFAEAEKNAPAIVFIDELDSIAPKRAESTGEVERRVVAQLLTLMDGLKQRRHIVVIGATNRLDAIDPALRRPGRFDREIFVGIPDQAGREEVLQIHTRGMPLAKDVDVKKLAETTHGYTGSDLAALAKEAAMATLRRAIPELDLNKPIPREALEKLSVQNADFQEGLRNVQPSALREILIEIPNVTWEQVGGLDEVKRLLHERVELPLLKPESFTRLGVKPPKGLLLYGPPGTGKTLLAKAVATEAGANFISAKGSSLLSKWYGESEKKIAELFHRARQVTPAIIFFDELDSLAPVRGGSLGEPQVTERVVNQMLAELDGMEELRGVVVLAATNRPDLIDPALLRPGRFDETVYVPIPDRAGRLAILKAHTRGMKLDRDVDLEKLAELTERFTGADLSGVAMKAGLLALRENAEAREIRQEHFLRAVRDTTPSVSEATEREYETLVQKVKDESVRIGFAQTRRVPANGTPERETRRRSAGRR